MKRIIECIPNFSEGRDAAKIRALVAAIRTVPGVAVLDQTMDADHHRSVITFAGEPEAVLEAALRAARRAVELIDLNHHLGEHPRLGALDVLPFVPIKGVTMDECVQIARRAGERLAQELGLPVYLYERAARRPERVDLAEVRRGEFEGLREEIATNPERRPDYGEAAIHPTAGAVAVGARIPLIAYNINLRTEDLTVAKKIAQAIRGRDGGLRYVKALGFELHERGQTQVSMNLVNYEETPVFRVFEMVKREAARYGVAIAGSELIGLVPQAALNACADFYLQGENFTADSVLEQRLQAVLAEAEDSDDKPPALRQLASFAAQVAAAQPTPGGDGCAAYAGALSAALGAMVCSQSLGAPGQLNLEAGDEVRELLGELREVGENLRGALFEEAESYARQQAAEALPQVGEADRLARQSALEQALKSAIALPRRIAEGALRALELLDELSAIEGLEASPELATGAQLALAAARGAHYNLCSKLTRLGDVEFSRGQRSEMEEMITRGQELADEVENRFLNRQANHE